MLLPTITFLCGPSGVGKTTLANALFDSIDGLQAHSLRAPLFGAARGAFFDCDPGLDLTFEPEKRVVPGLTLGPLTARSTTVADFTEIFYNILNEYYLPPALGRLAAHFATSATEFFDKVVFDDGDRSLIDDIRFVAKEFGEENCLIVNMTRTFACSLPQDLLRSDRIRCIEFANDYNSPQEMLAAFLALEATKPELAK